MLYVIASSADNKRMKLQKSKRLWTNACTNISLDSTLYRQDFPNRRVWRSRKYNSSGRYAKLVVTFSCSSRVLCLSRLEDIHRLTESAQSLKRCSMTRQNQYSCDSKPAHRQLRHGKSKLLTFCEHIMSYWYDWFNDIVIVMTLWTCCARVNGVNPLV